MNVLSRVEVRRGIEGLEEEREGVEIWLDTMKTHAEEDEEWGTGGRSLALDLGSNEGIPNEGFEGWVGEIKCWVRRGYELGGGYSHC